MYIEDNYLFENRDAYNHSERIQAIIHNIEKSIDYSNLKIYYSLLENVRFFFIREYFSKKKINHTIQKSFLDEIEEPKNVAHNDFSDDLTKLDYNREKVEKFLKLVNGVNNQTSKEELIKRLRLQLISRIAKQLNIKKILFATTCTKLTIELLNNVAIGKGAHLSQEMVFSHISFIYLKYRKVVPVTSLVCESDSLGFGSSLGTSL